jgi:hypothetical protein
MPFLVPDGAAKCAKMLQARSSVALPASIKSGDFNVEFIER